VNNRRFRLDEVASLGDVDWNERTQRFGWLEERGPLVVVVTFNRLRSPIESHHWCASDAAAPECPGGSLTESLGKEVETATLLTSAGSIWPEEKSQREALLLPT
jgi:hypothetical protein